MNKPRKPKATKPPKTPRMVSDNGIWMPKLSCVAGGPSIGFEIDCVENRQLFTEIFPVGLALDYDEPAVFLLVSTDPEEEGHERLLLNAV